MDHSEKTIVQSDWYIPRRLHDSPTKYDFPGDRFIPNRSLMNLDQAHSLLTNRTKELPNSKFSESYRQKLIESLNLDTEGRPFRMLVFRGSPKSSKRCINHIDEMRAEAEEALRNSTKKYECRRQLPKKEARVLDAPQIKNDYYLNMIDWGKNNILAVALGQTLYLWNSENKNIVNLLEVQDDNDYPSSVAWSENSRSLAVGYMCSKLQIWDTETSKCICYLEGHKGRVAALSWNGHTLTSGSQDKSIINHDVRMRHPTSSMQAHTEEVCGLKWSREGNVLASGGNENNIYIWEASKLSSSNFLHRFTEHKAAVKALAWCPYQFNVLASGGDLCIGVEQTSQGVIKWTWIRSHSSRVIGLSQSPDGLTVVSAGGDETLRFWEIFGPASNKNSGFSDLDSLLSLKTSPIR
ncbi:hypothetical protein JCGZ_26332 [Jatropha curcas]|uniref:CDC20/Fizzy WD40 domain-containing protein n=1 Tax=Jatropha curcas TaxID=180498 RepID=A0A067JF15_JATCU|nr:hypothetical protein JCGZ_26332 [Jatropha curcas]